VAETRAQGASEKKRGRLSRFIRDEFLDPERRTAYLMILPTLIIILGVAFYPVAVSFYYSLRVEIPGQEGGHWAGLSNYAFMFSDPTFWTAMINTVVFTVVSVTLEFLFGLAIALGINQAFRGRGLVRAAILVPWAFPVIISAVMWRLMYQDQVGIINYIATSLGLITQPILTDNTLIMIGAIVSDVWKTTPFMALLLLAGLQTIPGDVYEAAKVDGANRMQRFFQITLPLLKSAALVALLFRTLDAWRVYDLFWGMSDRQLDSLSTYVYKAVRISQLLFPVGNAAAVFTFLTAFAIALFFIKVLGMRTSTEE
jgi:trehalose/maltose transport system permease protein